MKKQSIFKDRTFLVMILLIILTGWVILCPSPGFAQPMAADSSTAVLSDTKLVLTEYDTYRLSLKNASGTILWHSDNTDVARVSKRGKVRAVGKGSCRIFAEYKEHTFVCRVKVKPLELTRKSLKILRGRQARLQFNKADIDAEWSSSDESVATVSAGGLIQAGLYPGSCEIIARYKGKEYTCQVAVTGISDTILTRYYRANKSNRGKILLAGSSSIDFWLNASQDFEPYEVLNLGYGGTTVVQWLEWYEKLIVRYKPSCVVLYVGSNDLVNTEGEVNAANTILLLKRIRRRLKTAPLYYVSVCPCWSRKELWKRVSVSNELVKQFCDSAEGITYIDIASAFLMPDGTPNKDYFLSDEIHPSRQGYLVWKRLVADRVKKDLKKLNRKTK